ncbi:hypothetical protein PR202_gb13223 [Eleusine coracana subsp. coracana]|uniref:RNase H type-1 domain-containing protein n=1 Tax=Eleusine coracana subsp. coracana TaxID=191504 RepID=A0AAV5ES05_ELECO|nr:hypothetical protein PR202_gb13223 [Eleusine coracana subsp. coracana]
MGEGGKQQIQASVGKKQKQTRENLKWEPPPLGWAKVNADGAYSQESGIGGAGVIIRDSTGKVLLSAWRVFFEGDSAEEVEARACQEGIDMAAEWIRGQVILESDCATVIQALKNKEPNRSALFFILGDILESCKSSPEVKFQAIRREQNCAAHELAQLAKHTTHTAMWCAQAPRCIEHLIAQDCNSYIG